MKYSLIVDDKIAALAVDEVHGFVFWSESMPTLVKRTTFDGSGITDIYTASK